MIKTVTVGDEIRTVGRPDHNGDSMEWADTFAKRHPKYVYGRKQGVLLHEVREMEFRWWKLGPGGAYWIRRKSPRTHFLTRCGMFFFGPDAECEFGQKESKAAVCEMPKPDAVLCKKCRGEGTVFLKGGQPKPGGPTRKEARARIGCVVAAESTGSSAPVSAEGESHASSSARKS